MCGLKPALCPAPYHQIILQAADTMCFAFFNYFPITEESKDKFWKIAHNRNSLTHEPQTKRNIKYLCSM
jgi:hypothetical protein